MFYFWSPVIHKGWVLGTQHLNQSLRLAFPSKNLRWMWGTKTWGGERKLKWVATLQLHPMKPCLTYSPVAETISELLVRAVSLGNTTHKGSKKARRQIVLTISALLALPINKLQQPKHKKNHRITNNYSQIIKLKWIEHFYAKGDSSKDPSLAWVWNQV